jgi:hypothetical protein
VPPKISAFLDFLAAALADFDRDEVALVPVPASQSARPSPPFSPAAVLMA